MPEKTEIPVREENITIEVSNACNSMCGHCFVRAGLENPTSLSLETVKTVLRDAFGIGYRHLHITGGEPFMWPYLLQTLDYSFALGYDMVYINSNGTLLDESICKELRTYGNRLFLSISLQGMKDFHDLIRGPGSWDKAAAGIDTAINFDLNVTVFSTVGKRLLDELPYFTKYVFSRFEGIEQLTLIQIIRVENDVFNLSAELLGPTDFIRLVKTVSLLNLLGMPVWILENPLANVVAAELQMEWTPPSVHLFRENRIVIMADETITLAHSSREVHGRYKEGALAQVIASPEYSKAVAADIAVCPQCDYVELCRSNGMMRPSEPFREMESGYFCKKVLECMQKVEI